MDATGRAAPEAYALARRMFNRALGGWASDILSLRKRGLDRPSMRPGWWERAEGDGAGEPVAGSQWQAFGDDLSADAA